jgi:hypothetical protein
MAKIVLFPLHRRQKLIREIREARSQKERRYVLYRVATKLDRLGIPVDVIDGQIRAVSLHACRQEWVYAPKGGAA